MLRHSLVIRHSCFVIVFALGMGNALAEKRPITEKDLWDFVWIGDPQVSPDGSRVAFVRVTVNEKKEGYNTSIWSVNLESGRPRPASIDKRRSRHHPALVAGWKIFGVPAFHRKGWEA